MMAPAAMAHPPGPARSEFCWPAVATTGLADYPHAMTSPRSPALFACCYGLARAAWVAVAVVVLYFAAGQNPAAAEELRPKPTPATLTAVQLISESPAETRFMLSFSPRPNSFGPVGADNSANSGKVSLGFALTTRGNGAVAPPHLKGLVRSISFDAVDTVLILRFGTTGPASVSALPLGASTIEITISNGMAQGSHATGSVPSANPLPQARQATPGEDGYELVMLRYADVSEVVGLLTEGLTVKSNDSFTPREPGFGSTSLTGGNYVQAGAVQSGPDDQPLGQSVDSAIAVDRRLNAVYLKGSKAAIQRMKDQISLIDVPVDSVILETELVELTESGAKAVGIDFTNASGQIAVGTLQAGQYAGVGVSYTGSFLKSLQMQAAISAQVQNGQGRIVSRPRIAALSGSTAKIVTGDALPILTTIALQGSPTLSQQVQYVNVGVTLQIAPRVAADGFVSSHVFCVVSSVTGYSQGYPTISQREAETSATVKDGETFIMGGLTQDSTINSNAKMPLLGDVPLFGQLFSNQKGSRSRTELYIVVTPHIVRHASSFGAMQATPAPPTP